MTIGHLLIVSHIVATGQQITDSHNEEHKSGKEIKLGIIDRKLREKRERRKAIIEAAKRVFFEKGYLKSSVSDIANEAELAKGTLYLYFKNKEALAGAIMNEILSQILLLVNEGIADAGKTIEKLRAIAEAFLTFMKEHKDYYKFLQYSNSIIPEKITPLSPFANSLQKVDALINIFEKLITDGMEDGSIRSHSDPHQSAIIYVNICDSFLVQLAARRRIINSQDGTDDQTMLKQMFDILIEALKK